MEVSIDTTAIAIICLSILEIVALLNHVDGAILSTVVGVISFLAGGKYVEKKKTGD